MEERRKGEDEAAICVLSVRDDALLSLLHTHSSSLGHVASTLPLFRLPRIIQEEAEPGRALCLLTIAVHTVNSQVRTFIHDLPLGKAVLLLGCMGSSCVSVT